MTGSCKFGEAPTQPELLSRPDQETLPTIPSTGPLLPLAPPFLHSFDIITHPQRSPLQRLGTEYGKPGTSQTARDDMEKRHFYTACAGVGETLSWPDEWYTESWYTASRSIYDQQASTGAVVPPGPIWSTDPACLALQTSVVSAGAAMTSTTTIPTITSNSLIASPTTALVVIPPPGSPITFVTPTSSPTFLMGAISGYPPSIPTCAGSWDWQTAGVVSSLVVGLVLGVFVWGLWAGLRGRKGLRSVYRGRVGWVGVKSSPTAIPSLLSIFALSTIFSSVSTRMKSTTSTSETGLTLFPILTILKLASLLSMVALATCLPLFLVNTPCLADTSPRSVYGGRLGSLNDLSILRLLDSLDPAPDSPSMFPKQQDLASRALPGTIRPVITSARTRLIILVVITIVGMVLPALWIILRALNVMLKVRERWLNDVCDGEEIWWLPLRSISRPGRTMSEADVQRMAEKHGLMGKQPPAETDQGGAEVQGDVNARIKAIYAIPDTTKLDTLVKRRSGVLDKLEMAQHAYIQSFKANPLASVPVGHKAEENQTDVEGRGSFIPKRMSTRRKSRDAKRNSGGVEAPTQYLAPKTFYKLRPLPAVPSTSDDLIPKISSIGEQEEDQADQEPSFTEAMNSRVTGTRFLEVQRNSGMFADLPVGSDLKIGKTGQLEPKAMPDTPDTESSLMGHGLRPTPEDPTGRLGGSNPLDQQVSRADSVRFPTPDQTRPSVSQDRDIGFRERLLPPAPPPKPHRPVAYQPLSTGDTFRRPSGRRPGNPSFVMVSEDQQILEGHQPPIRPHSGVSPLDVGSHYQDIKRFRPLLLDLNRETAALQGDTYEDMARGEGIVGFLVVGQNLHFHRGKLVNGTSREAILWQRLQRPNGSRFAFWTVTSIITVAACIAVTPFVCLGVASAPGLSHYIGFFGSLARDDGLPSGLAEGVAPAFAITLILVVAGYGVRKMSKLAGTITAQEQQSVRLQGLTFLLIVAGAIWPILAASSIYAVENLDDGIQSSRYVGDGSIFYSWNILCLMLNLAILTPGIVLLQPRHAIRQISRRRVSQTPRQNFRGNLPRPFDPSTILPVILYGLTLTLVYLPVFPLVAVPFVLFPVLTLVTITYNFSHSAIDWYGDCGGNLGIVTLRIAGWLLGLTPALLGLILLSRREWALGSVSLAVSLLIPLLFEILFRGKYRTGAGNQKKNTEAARALELEMRSLWSSRLDESKQTGESQPLASQPQVEEIRDRRRSNASIFELISGLSPSGGSVVNHGHAPALALPLPTEAVDDRIDTKRAAESHSPRRHDTPHVLPPLAMSNPLSSHAGGSTAFSSTSTIMDPLLKRSLRTFYPPGLVAPHPVVWVTDDKNGIGRMEVADLQRYHGIDGVVG